jgi:thioredoxin reductase
VHYDVVIIGGGPAGLSAALVLGRGRKRVLLCDAGAPRNARAERVQGFVTRDGTAVGEFRRIARQQLEQYGSVEVRELWVEGVEGERDRFRVLTDGGLFDASRVLLCVGMVDELPDLPGVDELWGYSVFQCPYCHAWEVRDGRFGLLATSDKLLEFALLLQAWTPDLIVFTDGTVTVEPALRAHLERCHVGVEERVVTALITDGPALVALELADGTRVEREFLFAKPALRQTELVRRLGLELDEVGLVRVDAQKRTSRPGLYAAGDLATAPQVAIVAAGDGAVAAYALNNELTSRRARVDPG